MILHYSSNNFSYKLGDSSAYIRKCQKGFYVDFKTQPIYFDNFIFTSIHNTYYLITTSNSEFVVYKITETVEKVLTICSSNTMKKPRLFEYVILKLNGNFVKITPDLNFAKLVNYAEINHNQTTDSKKQVELYECDLNIDWSLPVLYSLKAYAYYPYDGTMLKDFYFN